MQTPIRVPGQSEAGAAALQPERARSRQNTGAAGAALDRGRERDLALPQPGSTPVIRLLATLRVWDSPVLTVTSTLLAPSAFSTQPRNAVLDYTPLSDEKIILSANTGSCKENLY